MASIVLLFACLLLGVVLRHAGRLPENAHTVMNGFVFNVSLPALALVYLHGLDLQPQFALAVAMPWLLFGLGCGFFWSIGRAFGFEKATIGALMLVGGLANTSFVGLPMIEAFYGPKDLPTGILIDQLGTYLVLSTLGLAVAAAYSGGAVSPRDVALRVATFPPLLALVLALALSGVAFPAWLNDVLHRLAATLVPLALVSVGLQLRLSAVAGNVRALLAGLSFKLVLGPATVALLYIALAHAGGEVMRVTLFESAMGPMIGGAIVASQYSLNPPLVSLMVGTGITLSFVTLPLWYTALRFF